MPRFGFLRALVACLVLLAVGVGMPPALADPGAAEDLAETAGPARMDGELDHSDTLTGREGGAGHKPASELVDASKNTARSPRTGARPPAGWRVQLGAFQQRSRAEKARTTLVQTLAALPRARALVIDDSKDDGLFRVVLADAFYRRGEASATCAAVAALIGSRRHSQRRPGKPPIQSTTDTRS